MLQTKDQRLFRSLIALNIHETQGHMTSEWRRQPVSDQIGLVTSVVFMFVYELMFSEYGADETTRKT